MTIITDSTVWELPQQEQLAKDVSPVSGRQICRSLISSSTSSDATETTITDFNAIPGGGHDGSR
jgi:hypothetical protein